MNIIRRKRKELGISQKELSEKLGTSQQKSAESKRQILKIFPVVYW